MDWHHLLILCYLTVKIISTEPTTLTVEASTNISETGLYVKPEQQTVLCRHV